MNMRFCAFRMPSASSSGNGARSFHRVWITMFGIGCSCSIMNAYWFRIRKVNSRAVTGVAWPTARWNRVLFASGPAVAHAVSPTANRTPTHAAVRIFISTGSLKTKPGRRSASPRQIPIDPLLRRARQSAAERVAVHVQDLELTSRYGQLQRSSLREGAPAATVEPHVISERARLLDLTLVPDRVQQSSTGTRSRLRHAGRRLRHASRRQRGQLPDRLAPDIRQGGGTRGI